MSTLAKFAEQIAQVVPTLGHEPFSAALVGMLKQLSGADDGSLLFYREGQLPIVEFAQPVEALGKTTLDTYIRGPFLLDPFYRVTAIEGHFGVFRLGELAPRGFKDSEYYKTWYRNCGYQDECGLNVPLLGSGFVSIALGMTSKARRFRKRDADLLTAIYPAVTALCQQHWATDSGPGRARDLRQHLHDSLAAFGSSVLTRREQQVTELVLLGNSTRVIAEKLGISSETVKLHRKHAYAKLDVGSQAELFYLFMDALANNPEGGDPDPLVAYHAKPSKP
ncbi:transcriptional regulator, LuxR family [Luminiphilus syltensis NOR5-1B]|uniref:Transcriptional regulator, LuxR family n=1 Tax=Luminiphilus syltensis NOR5-1B TaxID=565045 RepID=B8KTL9_9GAMM|nr:LuxR family transcriptional regulator [Luminiphilus syltensis]EED36852.1 transcriptional regulator, LuxR family [Luminiphilus syltensis NOR5-1B]